MMNTCNAGDHQLNPETEIVSRQRLWLEVKLREILHGARTDPFIAAPLVVITIRRTHKSK
jgi:hypothetical protein